MSDGHEHGSGHTCKTDPWYQRILDYISGQISKFVAFLFLILMIGIAIGFYVVGRAPSFGPLIILIPAIAGLASYYNRDIATILFGLFLIFFIFL